MVAALREPFTETKHKEPITLSPISEFAERGKFLPFGEFIEDVLRAYEEAGSPGDVQKWYREEYKKHTGWPSNPHRAYKNHGWESFNKLVGKEVTPLLEYAQFVESVRARYQNTGSPDEVTTWYKSEYQTYGKERGWPAAPEQVYKNKGWKSYRELVGKEVGKQLEFLEFAVAVQAAYEAAGRPAGIAKWYSEQRKKERGWPANPEIFYNNRGWKSYRELVGKEVVKLLAFYEFVVAVKAAYEAAGRPGDISKWYQTEYKKHPGWPANPARTYQNNCWAGYPALVKNDKA